MERVLQTSHSPLYSLSGRQHERVFGLSDLGGHEVQSVHHLGGGAGDDGVVLAHGDGRPTGRRSDRGPRTLTKEDWTYILNLL